MQLAGPSLASRRKALQILRQIHAVSQRYFALVFLLNIAAGCVTALGLWALGVHHPVFWGIAMAVLTHRAVHRRGGRVDRGRSHRLRAARQLVDCGRRGVRDR
jgi:hypothetical protein